ncbi:MAG: glutamate--tRNA ligase [Candidatus Helarchaeota archaeon]|nr:glutamate--tRNA ligase [Candidatus Helarchaeota archaeon]
MDIEETIWIIGLENALKHSGKTKTKFVLKGILSEHPEYREKIGEIKSLIDDIVGQINKLSIDQQQQKFESKSPIEIKKTTRIKEEKELPPLENVDKYKKLTFRLAPYPSGPLHIGNARMVILNDTYKKMYKAKLFLVYDDTIGSEEKIIVPEAYDLIKENLEWLGVEIDKIFYKSDRIPKFYDYCSKLLEMHKAYVCTCDADLWRTEYGRKREKIGKPCPHRNQTIEENLEHWEKMLDGTYLEKQAVVRLKTGMELKNPAVRDHVIMRIAEREHPRVGSKFRVWPLLEFSWGIDDHLLGITHILRGKDLIKEDIIESKIWKLFNWPEIEFIHYGLISFGDLKLSKTYSRQQIKKGIFIGWDDPRTWSLNSLAKRGILSESLIEIILDLGLSLTDIKFDPGRLYDLNGKKIEKTSNRYFFVDDPIELIIKKIPDIKLIAEPLIHPDFPERGTRKIELSKVNGKIKVLVSKRDLSKLNPGMLVRLKDLFNIEILDIKQPIQSKYHSKEMEIARSKKFKILHWVPTEENVPISIILDDGNVTEGFGEPYCKNIKTGEILQFERFGFVKIDKISPQIHGFFTHR